MPYTPWTTRTVGVEMELLDTNRLDRNVDLSCGSLTRIVSEALVNVPNAHRVRNVGGYGHSDGTVWDIKTDSSCGFEVASPALRMDADGHNDALRAVCNSLTAVAKVNANCGLHVHVDVSDFDRKAFQRLLALWYRYEPFFYSLVAPSRATNQYCAPVRTTAWTRNTVDSWNETTARRALTASTDHAMMDALRSIRHGNTRTMGLNITGYALNGRVEFRLHHGTLDYAKIRGWVMWLTALVNRAKSGLHVAEVKRQVAKPMDATNTLAAEGLNSWRVANGLGLVGEPSAGFPLLNLTTEMQAWANERRTTFRRNARTGSESL